MKNVKNETFCKGISNFNESNKALIVQSPALVCYCTFMFISDLISLTLLIHSKSLRVVVDGFDAVGLNADISLHQSVFL